MTILHVEDDPAHAHLVRKNLKRSEYPGNVINFEDGRQIIDFLNKKESGEYYPFVILLDLNLPGIDGFEVLKTVKDDKDTMRIPVIVLSTNGEKSEVDSCYEKGANFYVRKPFDYSEFSAAVRKIAALFELIESPSYSS